MNVQNMAPKKGSVLVTHANLPTGIIYKNQHHLANINCWHKFTVIHTENSSRNEILGAILDNVHPLDLIPVCFWKDKLGSHFLARNCGPAIQKLCNDNLVVANPNSSIPFKISIILKFATIAEFKIDVQKYLLAVITKRYDPNTKTLDLVNFSQDPDLTEFCPLSQPKIMFFVLHLSKSLIPPPESFLLANNKIKLLNPLEALNSSLSQVRHIDLRNNLISDITALNHLKSFKLKELYLDGNPLCEDISVEKYITEIRGNLKDLMILDGVSLKQNEFPIAQKTFLCDPEGLNLVNQFLEHYFFIYDSQNRKLLQDLYHKNAMFSLTSFYHNHQLSSATTRLFKYNNISRNLQQLADFSRAFKNLFQGSVQIANILCDLPATEHDPFSFVVDLMYYTSRCAIVAISGVFRERPETLLETEKLYGFRRIFTLEIVNGDGLTYITNEEFHVHNAFSWQVIDSFKIAKSVAPSLTMVPQTEKERQKTIETLKIISTLNNDWCKKCLEECNYDLKKALTLFVDLYKQNRIPEEGFVDNKRM